MTYVSFFVLSLMLLLPSGCGVRGDLYRSDEPHNEKQASLDTAEK